MNHASYCVFIIVPSSLGGDSNKTLYWKYQSLKLFGTSFQPKVNEWSTYSLRRGEPNNNSSPVSPTLKKITENTPRLNLPCDISQLGNDSSPRDDAINEVKMSEEITPGKTNDRV